MTEYSEYGKLVRRMRRESGLCQAHVEDTLGLGSTVLCKVESGARPPMGVVKTLQFADLVCCDPRPLLMKSIPLTGIESGAIIGSMGDRLALVVELIVALDTIEPALATDMRVTLARSEEGAGRRCGAR